MSRDYADIPEAFYRESWEDADHPMACVDTDNTFRRVNHAFERMLGYSTAELENRAWMEFTDQRHVGGDIASVQAVLDGRISSYRLEKDYIHKRGHKVPIILHVRRYPRNAIEPLLFFRVEAPIATATRPEVDEVEKHALAAVQELRNEMDRIKQGVIVSQRQEQNAGGDIVGRDKTTNSDKMIRWLAVAIIALGAAVAYMAYYMASASNNNQNIQPPNITVPSE